MSENFGGYQQLSWLENSSRMGKVGPQVKVFVVGRESDVPPKVIQTAPKHLKEKIKAKSSVVSWSNNSEDIWLLQLQTVETKDHYGLFSTSPYSMARDLVGTCFRQIISTPLKSIEIHHLGDCEEEFLGLCVGMEMGRYSFKNLWPKVKNNDFKLILKSSLKNYKNLIKQASILGESINLSRYLVDLPPNVLHPQSYASLLSKVFRSKAKTKVSTWNMQRLKKERMNLHVAVGQGAESEPQLVHIQYRNGGKSQPIAFVGKGITFDAGGLDIKPSQGMRLMKKDMGGSASVAGIALWVVNSQIKINCDFYFAIAENSVGEKSFRPGDVITSRSGLTVEIHNTDAEGRLVMAEALTLAAEQKPQMIIDIATLTGAIKYGLGSSVPGFFSNRDNLAEVMMKMGQRRGDVFWRMPLIPQEKSRLKSDVADLVNCTDGYGGAVTAALFLENFVGGIPWAHFDIYAWMNSATNVFGASGGSGQIVQALTLFLSEQEKA